MILVRLILVLVITFAVLLLARLYRQWKTGLHTEARGVPALPESIRAGAERTWVIFTTPLCASCKDIEARLRKSDPAANVVSIDSTREPNLSRAFRVRSAPTVLLADSAGRVTARLVGAEAFDRYVRKAT